MFFNFLNKKQVPRWRKYLESATVAIGIVFIWKGIWGIADYVFHSIFPKNIWFENLTSFCVGVIILVITDRFIEQFTEDE